MSLYAIHIKTKTVHKHCAPGNGPHTDGAGPGAFVLWCLKCRTHYLVQVGEEGGGTDTHGIKCGPVGVQGLHCEILQLHIGHILNLKMLGK